MKYKIFILLVFVFTLTGCLKNEKEYTPMQEIPNQDYDENNLNVLPIEFEDWLKKNHDTGPIMYAMIATKKGNILLAGTKAKLRSNEFPVPTTSLIDAKPIAQVDIKGSHCRAHVEGGSVAVYCYGDDW